MLAHELYILLGQNPKTKCFKVYKEGCFCNTRYSIGQVIEFIIDYNFKLYTAYMVSENTMIIEVK